MITYSHNAMVLLQKVVDGKSALVRPIPFLRQVEAIPSVTMRCLEQGSLHKFKPLPDTLQIIIIRLLHDNWWVPRLVGENGFI